MSLMHFACVMCRCLEAAAKGLGMKVMTTNSDSSRQELEQLLQQSDVVSLHVPLNHQTQVNVVQVVPF